MRKVIIVCLIILIQMGWSLAQRGQLASIERFLFPPELVMRNQEELQLTEEQRSSIMSEVQRAQSEFTALHWDLEREMEKLTTLLRGQFLAEEAILRQLESVLDLERKVKRNQLQLAVRIRNALNEEQLKTLRRLRIRSGVQQRARDREPSVPR
jgi:hypothetical protein